MIRGFVTPRWMLHLYPPYVLEKVRNKGLFWSIRQSPSYFIRLVVDLSLLPLAILLRIVLLVLKPFVHIRFGQLWCDRLGPFSMFPELYLCEQDAGVKPSRGLEIWYHYDRDAYMLQKRVNPRQAICNQQLNTMWERVLRVHDVAKYLDRLNRLLGPGSRTFTVDMATEMADWEVLLGQFPAHLEFTDEEEEFGLRELQLLGIGPDDVFVCFHARDSAYLNRVRPRNVDLYGDWSWQDIRDAPISDHLPAAEELAELGYFAVRMGKYVDEPLESDNPRVIDYATRFHSDFMDLYLTSHCTFFICHDSGISALPMIFRKPMVFVNIFPLHDVIFYQYKNGISLPKTYYSEERGRFLTFREVFDLGLGRFNSRDPGYARLAKSLGLRVIDNTAEDIRKAAIEMHQRITSSFEQSAEDLDLQRQFMSIINANSELMHSRDEISNLTIATGFLRAHAELLD